MSFSRVLCLLVFALCATAARAQMIEFESGGLHYQALTRQGITVMVAKLPAHMKDYVIMQVAVSNGSKAPALVRPEDFRYLRPESEPLAAEPARRVINRMLERGNRSDVLKLINTYEAGLYGLPKQDYYKGYQQRRDAAVTEFTNAKIKAAAAASAIALVPIKLAPGETTDGAVFYPTTNNRPLGSGTMVVIAGNMNFEFPLD